MKRYRLYLESSFWVRLADSEDDGRRKVSYRFLRAIFGKHRVFASRLVAREVGAAPDLAERRMLNRRMRRCRSRMLPAVGRVLRIRDEIVKEAGWGEGRLADALHIAYSVSGRMNALVSWDVAGLARDSTRRVVERVCRSMGVAVPRIGTPEEVSEWLGIRMK